MDVSSLLLLSIALPLLGAIFIGLVAPGDRGSIRTVAFVISLMTFGCVVAVGQVIGVVRAAAEIERTPIRAADAGVSNLCFDVGEFTSLSSCALSSAMKLC